MKASGILKQQNNKKLGEVVNVLYLTMPVLGLLSYLGVALTTYATFVTRYFPWLTFPYYITAILVIALSVLFLFWKFVYLSYFNNPINQNVVKIMTKLGIKDEEK